LRLPTPAHLNLHLIGGLQVQRQRRHRQGRRNGVGVRKLFVGLRKVRLKWS
jgi:hypothetical protein